MMVLCGPECVTFCDFCIHVQHEEWDDSAGHHIGGPEACLLHPGPEHQKFVDGLSYCEDFHCFRAEGGVKNA